MKTFLNGKVTLHAGDSREVLMALPDASIDSVVCDPPYGLGFMGRHWDAADGAPFAVEFWAEVLRVLKPGGHVVAFSGTRTYHRMACAIEDAGFEIRDSIYYHYGSGFPKSHNVGKQLDAAGKRCVCGKDMRDMQGALDAEDEVSGNAQSDVQPGLHGRVDRQPRKGADVTTQSADNGSLRGLRSASDTATVPHQTGDEAGLLQDLQRGIPRTGLGQARTQGKRSQKDDAGRANGKEPSLEGWGDTQAAKGELQGCALRQGAGMGTADGTQGWLHHGASACDGADVRAAVKPNGSGQSHRPEPKQQSPQQSGNVPDQCGPQAWGGWQVCSRCRKPMVPDDLGTALKPATEPICLARKPLIGTVAANVLQHGTGALNIDGCRIPSGQDHADKCASVVGFYSNRNGNAYGEWKGERQDSYSPSGRWPANLCHDGSKEVLEAFPDVHGAGAARDGSSAVVSDNYEASAYMLGANRNMRRLGDEGSAARFFYTAKADAEDRLGSKHPTVKPLDLMQWLVRLVTPKGGVVLDPFAGTGTTGEAAWREGMRAVLIEREAEYQADIARRMELAVQPTKRAAVAKTKNKLDNPEDLPLFAAGTP